MPSFTVEYEDPSLASTVTAEDPLLLAMSRSFVDAMSAFPKEPTIQQMTVIVGANLRSRPSIAWTMAGKIWVCVDVVGLPPDMADMNIRTGSLDDLHFARFCIIHEIVHNVYAPESVLLTFASWKMIEERDTQRAKGTFFGDHNTGAFDYLGLTDAEKLRLKSDVVTSPKTGSIDSYWNLFGSLGDILVNGHLLKVNVPGWDHKRGMRDYVRKVFKSDLTDKTSHFPNVSTAMGKQFLRWMRWLYYDRETRLAPQGSPFRDRLNRFIDDDRPAKQWISEFYPEFITLMCEWRD